MQRTDTTIAKGKYHFTDSEKASLSMQLANKQIDKRIIEDEKKSVMSDYKDRIDRFNFEINKFSRSIVDGYEMRDFECLIEKDYDAHLKRFKDIHSGRIIDERPLDPSDYQHKMEM